MAGDWKDEVSRMADISVATSKDNCRGVITMFKTSDHDSWCLPTRSDDGTIPLATLITESGGSTTVDAHGPLSPIMKLAARVGVMPEALHGMM